MPLNQKAKQVFEKYRETPLVGLFNIKTKEIVLAPCITEKVNITIDENDRVISGYFIDMNWDKIRDCDHEELEKISDQLKQGYMPRFIQSASLLFNKKSSHDLLFEQEKLEMQSDWRGFTLNRDQSGNIDYKFISGSFNSQPGHRTPGATLDKDLQKQIINEIEGYQNCVSLVNNKYCIPIDRQSSEDFLRKHPTKTILRKSISREGQFVVSENIAGVIHHYLILVCDNGFILAGTTLPTIEKLLEIITCKNDLLTVSEYEQLARGEELTTPLTEEKITLKKPKKHPLEKKHLPIIDRIDQILNEFKERILSIGNPNTLNKAWDLLTKLTEARNTYEQNMENSDSKFAYHQFKQIFDNSCKQAITEAKPILEKDLGWGDYLNNLLKSLTNTAIWVISLGNVPSLFSPVRSKSLEVAEDVEKDLSSLLIE